MSATVWMSAPFILIQLAAVCRRSWKWKSEIWPARQAAKLMRTFATMAECLRTYRGGGQQKMTVEHVTVQAGGQAIVGTVNRGEGNAKKNGE